jgi:hypothetical protein
MLQCQVNTSIITNSENTEKGLAHNATTIEIALPKHHPTKIIRL